MYCSSLTSVNIPNSVTYLGMAAFDECSSLTSLEIPSSVTWIDIIEGAFSGCSSLTSLIVDENNPNYSSENDILYDKDKTVLIKCAEGKTGQVIIPDSVTRIRWHAFMYCSSLSNVQIPEGVTSIGDYAFYRCSGLTSMEIPEGVTDIREFAFSGCSSLTSVEIPSSVTSIAGYAFSSCSSLTSVVIPEGVTSIGNRAFEGCSSLTSVNIPSSVTSIGSGAFSSCSTLTSITVDVNNPNYSSENDILYNKEKTILVQCAEGKTGEVIIPSSVTSITNYAFEGCSSLIIYTNSSYVANYAENNNIKYIYYDIISPQLTVSGNSSIWTNKDVSLNITATDSESGIANVTVNGEAINLNNGGGSYTITENGTYTVIASDNAGNETTEAITVGKIDKVIPKLTVSGNPATWTNKDVSLNITATDSESGIANVTVNGEAINLNNGGGSYIVTENGTYAVVATDNAGNTKTETVEVNKLDKTVPIINSITKSTEQEEVEMLTLTVNAVDNESGISGYSWNNGQTWETSNEYEVRRNGTYTVKVKDKAGNISIKSITVSNIKETEEAYFALNNYEIKEKEETSYVVGISSQTSISDFKQYIQTNMEYSMVDKNENTVNDNNIVATGMKIKSSDGKQYILVVNADLNSDGKADITDLGIMARYVVGKGSLNSTYLLAGNLNRDNTVDITDVSILAMAITRDMKL